MARVILVHLSDIHVVSSEDAILDRHDTIAAAAQSMDFDCEAVIIVVTGDLAYSGRDHQYIAFWEFIESLQKAIQRRFPVGANGDPIAIHTVSIPGNHDCDFSGATSIRAILVDKILKDHSASEKIEIVQNILEVQASYFDSLDWGSSRESHLSPPFDRIAYQYTFDFGSTNLKFVCLNSAWLSQLGPSQGKLYIPNWVIPLDHPHNAVVGTLFHHPYGWYSTEDYRELRSSIESISDLMLTGHEHVSSMRSQQLVAGGGNMIIEGGALQPHSDEPTSEFNVIVLDLQTRTHKTGHFIWTDDHYSCPNLADILLSSWDPLPSSRIHARGAFTLSAEMQVQIESLNAPIVHKHRGLLKLSDIFVFPNLRKVNAESDSSTEVIREGEVAQLFSTHNNLVILGESRSGKTALARMVFAQQRAAGYIPVLIDGERPPRAGDSFKEDMVRLFLAQYDSTDPETYMQLERPLRTVIIDNYQEIRRSNANKVRLLRTLQEFAGQVIIFGNGIEIEMSQMLSPDAGAEFLTSYDTYRILPMGKVLRNALVEKWLLLEEDIESNLAEFAFRREELLRVLDTLTANERLPRYPMYILGVLRASEIGQPLNAQISTNGAYYELFIRGALGESRTAEESDRILTYLSELAHNMFQSGRRYVSRREFHQLHQSYESKYWIEFNEHDTLNTLIKDQILEESGDNIRFKHKYVFYYFIARWITKNLELDDTKLQVRRLTQTVHEEDYANILMFLSHLTSDPIVIDELLRSARLRVVDVDPANLRDEVRFLEVLETRDNHPVFRDGDEQENRRQLLRSHDDHVEEWDESQVGDSLPELSTQEETQLDPIGEMVASMKTVEVLGQLLKNFPGSLVAERKVEVSNACHELGLRVLGMFYKLIDITMEQALSEFERIILAGDPALTALQAQQRARDVLLGLSQSIGSGLISFIGDAVGTSSSDRLLDHLDKSTDLISVHLINAYSRMAFSRQFPQASIVELIPKVNAFPFAKAVLQQLVLVHFHVSPVDARTKRAVCEALDINYTNAIAATAGGS